MSQSINVAGLNFNDGFGLPYTVFTPVYWAPLNSSGVGAPAANTGDLGGVSTYGAGITPSLLAAAQDNLAGISYTGLNTVTESGENSQLLIGSLFQNWGDTLGSIAQQNANTFQQVANNSAKACSGFLGCFFGF
jgi:hypothetical protein